MNWGNQVAKNGRKKIVATKKNCGNDIAEIEEKKIVAIDLWQWPQNFFFSFYFSNSIATIFFPFYFGNAIATIFLVATKFVFSPIFSNLVATIHIPFRALHLAQHLGLLGATRISVISLLKYNFFSLLHHITYLPSLSYFFLQFRQRCYQNLLSFLIFLNNFKQYLYH